MTMHMTTKPERRVAAIGASLALLTCSLIGCAPDPAPTPTPTPAFASEEEAFAAAEEVYRAYNEAENRSRTTEESDGPAPEEYLVGTALEGYIDGRDLLRQSNLLLEGDIGVIKFLDWSTDLKSSVVEISATVCLDLEQTRTVELSSGTDLSSPSRPVLMSQRISLIHDGDHLLISEESEGDLLSCSGN